MGASGRYGGRFRLRGVVSPVDGAAVYDGATRRIVRRPEEWRGRDGEAARSIQLDFQTPLRMRTEGNTTHHRISRRSRKRCCGA